MKRVIASTVSVLLTESGTHFETKLRCDSDVASVKETVQVGPKQKPIPNLVRPVVGV